MEEPGSKPELEFCILSTTLHWHTFVRVNIPLTYCLFTFVWVKLDASFHLVWTFINMLSFCKNESHTLYKWVYFVFLFLYLVQKLLPYKQFQKAAYDRCYADWPYSIVLEEIHLISLSTAFHSSLLYCSFHHFYLLHSLPPWKSNSTIVQKSSDFWVTLITDGRTLD